MIDKKKIKEEYKLVVPPKGVFAIKNLKTGRVWLGSTMNLKNIYIRYQILLNNGKHINSRLQEDWHTFGEESFEFEVLDTLELKEGPDYNYSEDLEILEMLWLDKFRPLEEKTYNKNEKIRVA
ncbi:MAG: GIY-YIG nuclease family protein [Bacteroidota bacterium]